MADFWQKGCGDLETDVCQEFSLWRKGPMKWWSVLLLMVRVFWSLTIKVIEKSIRVCVTLGRDACRITTARHNLSWRQSEFPTLGCSTSKWKRATVEFLCMELMPANTCDFVASFVNICIYLKASCLGVTWIQGNLGLHLYKNEFIGLVCAKYSQEISKKVSKMA